jgi:hypothetical protein
MGRPNASYPDLANRVENVSIIRTVKEKPIRQHNSNLIIEPELMHVMVGIIFLASIILIIIGVVKNPSGILIGVLLFLGAIVYAVKIYKHASTVGSTNLPEVGFVKDKTITNGKHEIAVTYDSSGAEFQWFAVTKKFYNKVNVNEYYDQHQIIKSFK